MSRSLRTALLLPALALALSACTEAELRENIDKARDVAAERSAMLAGESLRLVLIERKVPRVPVSLLQETASSVPGLSFTALDADGDGFDDDGRVTIAITGGQACLTLPTATDRGTTVAGPCA